MIYKQTKSFYHKLLFHEPISWLGTLQNVAAPQSHFSWAQHNNRCSSIPWKCKNMKKLSTLTKLGTVYVKLGIVDFFSVSVSTEVFIVLEPGSIRLAPLRSPFIILWDGEKQSLINRKPQGAFVYMNYFLIKNWLYFEYVFLSTVMTQRPLCQIISNWWSFIV